MLKLSQNRRAFFGKTGSLSYDLSSPCFIFCLMEVWILTFLFWSNLVQLPSILKFTKALTTLHVIISPRKQDGYNQKLYELYEKERKISIYFIPWQNWLLFYFSSFIQTWWGRLRENIEEGWWKKIQFVTVYIISRKKMAPQFVWNVRKKWEAADDAVVVYGTEIRKHTSINSAWNRFKKKIILLP